MAGQTSGLRRSETKTRAGSVSSAVNGSASASGGAWKAAESSRANTALGTDCLSSGTGNPPSDTWKTPWVVRRSLAGLWRTPCCSR